MPFFKYAFPCCLLFLACCNFSEAQTALRRSNIMTFNPSVVGEEGNSRLSLFNRNRNFFLEKEKLINYSITYDQYAKAIKGGIGGAFQMEETDRSRKFYLSILYAPKITFDEKFTLSPGLSMQYANERINYKHLNREIRTYKNEYLNYNAGLMVNFKKWYVGLSFFTIWRDLLDKKGYRLFVDDPIAGFQMGYTYRPRWFQEFSFTPEVFLDSYLHSYTSTLRGTFNWKNILFGAGLGELNSLMVMFGITLKKKLTIQYAMDHTNAYYRDAFIRSHEIAFQFRFNERNNSEHFIQRNLNGF